MDYFLIGVFLLAGLHSLYGAWKCRRYLTLRGIVIQIDESEIGRYRAVVRVPGHGNVEIPYEDGGTYRLNQDVRCLWDGIDPQSITADFRVQLLIGGMMAVGISVFALLMKIFRT